MTLNVTRSRKTTRYCLKIVIVEWPDQGAPEKLELWDDAATAAAMYTVVQKFQYQEPIILWCMHVERFTFGHYLINVSADI